MRSLRSRCAAAGSPRRRRPAAPGLHDRVPPQDQQHRRGQQQADAVEGGRDPFGAVLADVVREQPGGEREERDEQEQQQVQPDERGVGAIEVLGDRVVRQPGRADGGEADHVGQVRGPQVDDRAQQVLLGVGGDRDVEDQLGDGDGEHAVAEGLQPPGTETPAPRLRRRFLSAHRPDSNPRVSGGLLRGRPGLRISPALPGSRPASASARRSRNSIWALVLRNSSAAHLARAS